MNKEEVDRLDHIVVIGGGITGLSAAWYLQTGSQRPFKITLVEGSPALGGKMTTRKIVRRRAARAWGVMARHPGGGRCAGGTAGPRRTW